MILDPALLVLAESKGFTQTQWLVIIACIVAITLLLLRSQRRRGQGASPRQYRREIDSATNQSAAIKRDMERLLVELNELARQINAQVDTKFAKLEQSIADADRRISALNQLIENSEQDQTTPASDPIPTPRRVPGDRSKQGIQRESSRAPSEALSGSAPAGQLDFTVDDSGVSKPATVRQASTDGDELNRRIYALADQGRGPVEIARALQQSIGEVELILKLRQRGGV